MKLSQAILKGCKIAPSKCLGELFGEPGEACALGAALLGAGYRPRAGTSENTKTRRLKSTWPFLRSHKAFQDASKGFWETDLLYEQILHLNDTAMWSRQHIAHWLAKHGL